MDSFRLRIIIGLVMLGMLVLLGRAVQVQYFQHDEWVKQAQQRMEDETLVETNRGRIVDYRGRELAVDAACLDAVVDYRVIASPPDEKWVRAYARQRVRNRLGEIYRQMPGDRQARLIDDQVPQVLQDIERMWQVLGDNKVTGQSSDQIEERRRQVVNRVQMRRRYLMYRLFVLAQRKHQKQAPSAWWQNWLTESGSPKLDAFDITVGEQERPHVILSAVSADLANYLGKNLDRLPGLSLQPGQHRSYPYGESACHVIGYMTQVSREDVLQDPAKGDELRRYLPTDLTGRQGMEKLCDAVLRGTRGRIRRNVGDDALIESIAPVPGKEVRLSIDIKLQQRLEDAFAHPKKPDGTTDPNPLHGAAIMVDVRTGQVRALASYPTYDLNQMEQIYPQLVKDYINTPLLNRATQAALEPGSIVKPMLGLAGVTEKKVGIFEGIECTGYMIVNGKKFRDGKCWVVALNPGDPAHHHVPSEAPHVGTHGNPDGFLTYTEALQRSCNIWCETVAGRLGMERIADWYGRFGLGRPTGIGLPERAGRLPRSDDLMTVADRRSLTWFAGIGQGQVNATPIQMANVAATIARDGVWMRPTLVAEGWWREPKEGEVDVVKLPLNPQALVACKEGMKAVVNTPAGGGKILARKDMVVAGKTGTAQAAKFNIIERDANGEAKQVDGREVRRFLEPSTATKVNAEAPWYRATGANEDQLNHAWMIGFAPADNPQIAFAAMVEYGGGGGRVAGPVAKAILDAAVEEGYLAPLTVQPSVSILNGQ